MSTLSHGVIAVVRDLIESETTFFRTAVALPEPQRSRILGNRSRMAQDILSLMRFLVNPPQPQQRFVVNIPLDLNATDFEPVHVTPSTEQIAAAMETGVAAPADGLCAVCQDGFVVPCARLTRCGHHFHVACISQWFRSSVRCPVCRDDVREGPPEPNASAGGSHSARG
jgi:hypothetical protein